ncbi:beta-N-acetylhexosaminidase [Pedobacter immunditicola]|uniref:beta-N-acetylhexosaminidase n=1 Tax=Pedobacter immunditicola TaxID=3133440 RepID=UPI0030AE8AD5
MKLLLNSLIAFLLISSAATAQLPDLIPQPVEMKAGLASNQFTLNSNTIVLTSDTALRKSAAYLTGFIQQHYHLSLDTAIYATNEKRKNVISLIRTASVPPNLNQYTLSVVKNAITISAATDEGIFYGVQTLLQLLPVDTTVSNYKIAAVDITDYPRFDYRGMHLDVSRHFFDVAFVKKYIDYLAMHKLNYFHWHLTDDHGWRIEIKKYPELTEIGAWRNGTIIGLYPGKGNDGIRYGGYYTQEEIKEVVKYATDRYITVIPEIEMPGHSLPVLAAFPALSTTPAIPKKVAETWGIFNKFNNVLLPSEQTFTFLEDVLTEVMELFPSPYIHIGGDECAKIWWKQSAFTQKLIKEKGLKDENGVQSYFIHRIEEFVNSKGKTIIGWDEILDGGLAPNAIVMSWRGEKGGIAAAKQKHKVIMTPENAMYFNHSQFMKDDSLTANKFIPLEVVYHYDPVSASLAPEDEQYIWGGQGNLWSEYISNPAKVEYMLFPRLDALSEILWSPKNKRNYPDFKRRLKTQFKRYDLLNINYPKRYL